jgi:hypothetical protein
VVQDEFAGRVQADAAGDPLENLFSQFGFEYLQSALHGRRRDRKPLRRSPDLIDPLFAILSMIRSVAGYRKLVAPRAS